MRLIIKALSYISSKSSKYYKEEISISKDEKLKLQVFISVVEFPLDAKLFANVSGIQVVSCS